MVYRWLRRLEGLLLPHRCLLCGAVGEDGMDICQGCGQDLPWNRRPCQRCANPLPPGTRTQLCGDCQSGRTPKGFDQIMAPLLYDFPVDRLILALKFQHELAPGRLLGSLCAHALATEGIERPQGLVPVPLHPARWRQRGFNQAVELARPLSRQLGVPILTRGLKRQRSARPQSELPLDQRRRNVHGLFRVSGPVPNHVAIVDDVVTSASTVAELAQALKQAGASRVDVWAIARTP